MGVVGDAELISGARVGDADAYAELFRRHSAAALRFARTLVGRSADAEDLVADAFVRVLAALRGGNGPDEAFRPYLLSAVRNAFYDQARRASREQTVNELARLASTVPSIDPLLDQDERRLIATAFSELPERWQVVLWHTEVEGEKPAELAPLLGISPNAVAALAYRAREGLRERYLQAHLRSTTDERCRPVIERLAGYVRRKLSRVETKKIKHHLDGCDRCRLIFGELDDINRRLGMLLGPIVLAGAAAGYVASGGASGTVVASALLQIARRPDAQIGVGAAVAASVVALVVPFVSTPAPTPSEAGPSIAAPIPTVPSAPATPSREPPPAPTHTPGPDSQPPAATDGAPSHQPNPLATTSGGEVGLSATLEPIGSLVRGRPGLLLLTVTNSTATPVAVTAAVSLPAGVTLHNTHGGHRWSCASTDTVICNRANLGAGQTSKAHLHLLVAEDAADGVPFAQLSGEGLPPVTAVASHGVVSHCRDAVPEGATPPTSSWPKPPGCPAHAWRSSGVERGIA